MRSQRSKQYERCIQGRDWLSSWDKTALSVMFLLMIGVLCRQTKPALSLHGVSPVKGT